ncbi:MAG: hypothetical protein AAF990_08345 [Bacteroidota bacterium]
MNLKNAISVITSPKRLSNSINYRLKNKKVNRLYQDAIKNNPETFQQIRKVLEHFHGGGGYVRQFQDFKVFSLYQILNEYKPKVSIEFGSGVSTYAFSKYATENPGVKHTTVEESEKWMAHTKGLIQGIGIDPEKVNWVHGEKVIDQSGELTEIHVKQEFPQAFDLVFVDGPTLKINNVQNSEYINTDIFRICEHNYPKVIVVDIRMYTVKQIQKRIGHLYHCEESHLFEILKKDVRDKFNYYTVFIRK